MTNGGDMASEARLAARTFEDPDGVRWTEIPAPHQARRNPPPIQAPAGSDKNVWPPHGA